MTQDQILLWLRGHQQVKRMSDQQAKEPPQEPPQQADPRSRGSMPQPEPKRVRRRFPW